MIPNPCRCGRREAGATLLCSVCEVTWRPPAPLTEEDVRRIVREEIRALTGRAYYELGPNHD